MVHVSLFFLFFSMQKAKALLAGLLTIGAIATTAIPIASAKPPMNEAMIQHREEMAQKIADLLGIDVETLKTEREAGKKLMEIAEEYGASEEVIEQLKEMKKNIQGKRKHHFSKEGLEQVADAMDITTEDLVDQLKDGAKLKNLAEEYGVDLKEFKPGNQKNGLMSNALVN